MLERYEGKLSRTVLRRGVAGNRLVLSRRLAKHAQHNHQLGFLALSRSFSDLTRKASGAEVSLTRVYTSFVLLRIRLTIAESSDSVAKNRRLPAIEPGNVAAVLNSGAYGFSMSCQYNGK